MRVRGFARAINQPTNQPTYQPTDHVKIICSLVSKIWFKWMRNEDESKERTICVKCASYYFWIGIHFSMCITWYIYQHHQFEHISLKIDIKMGKLAFDLCLISYGKKSNEREKMVSECLSQFRCFSHAFEFAMSMDFGLSVFLAHVLRAHGYRPSKSIIQTKPKQAIPSYTHTNSISHI